MADAPSVPSHEIDKARRRRDAARAETQRVRRLVALQQDYLITCEEDEREAELALAWLLMPTDGGPSAPSPSATVDADPSVPGDGLSQSL